MNIFQKTVLGVVLSAVMLVNGGTAYAVGAQPEGRITAIGIDGSTALLWSPTYNTNTGACSGAASGIAIIDISTYYGREMLKLAEAAYLANKTVRVFYDTNVCGAIGGMAPWVTRIDIF